MSRGALESVDQEPFRYLLINWKHCQMQYAKLLITHAHSSCIFSVMVAFKCDNGMRVALVDVFEEPPEEESWGIQVSQVRCSLHFRFAGDETLLKPFTKSCHGKNSTGKIKPQIPPQDSQGPRTIHRTVQALECNVLLSLSLGYPDHL